MTDTRYNGWANRETWTMALWIDNEEGSYRYSRDLAREALKDSVENEGAAVILLAERLKDWQQQAMPDLDLSAFSDLLTSAFEKVNWREIAENYIEEVVEG